MRVQVVDGEYRIVVPPEAAEAMNLREGIEVELTPVGGQQNAARYVSAEEAIASYLRTESLHHQTYTELAK